MDGQTDRQTEALRVTYTKTDSQSDRLTGASSVLSCP